MQVALEMLKELENDGSLPRRNLLRATTLSTACGERYACCPSLHTSQQCQANIPHTETVPL